MKYIIDISPEATTGFYIPPHYSQAQNYQLFSTNKNGSPLSINIYRTKNELTCMQIA